MVTFFRDDEKRDLTSLGDTTLAGENFGVGFGLAGDRSLDRKLPFGLLGEGIPVRRGLGTWDSPFKMGMKMKMQQYGSYQDMK